MCATSGEPEAAVGNENIEEEEEERAGGVESESKKSPWISGIEEPITATQKQQDGLSSYQ